MLAATVIGKSSSGSYFHYGADANTGMAFGKREQIVGISLAAIGAILLVHFMVFQQKAKTYDETKRRFSEGVTQMTGAEIVTSPKQLEDYRTQTQEYSETVTSVSEALNVGVPDYFASDAIANYSARIDETTSLLKQLVDLRASVQQPQLRFLDNMPAANGMQQGWSLPASLPNIGAEGAYQDYIARLDSQRLIMQSVSDPTQKLQQRNQYNQFLQAIQVPPAEVCLFYRAQPFPVFFNDPALLTAGPLGNQNPFCLDRFGPAVPELKKLHMFYLITQLQPGDSVFKDKVYAALECNLPLDQTLLHINKQLRALIDLIRIAEKHQVVDIFQVTLMRPVELGKITPRVPGETPPPSDATPAPGAQPMDQNNPMASLTMNPAAMNRNQAAVASFTPIPADQKVGTGTGIEIGFRATNVNMVNFLFEAGAMPRTYAVDDLYIYANPDSVLTTTATIELVTKLDKLSGDSQAGGTQVDQ